MSDQITDDINDILWKTTSIGDVRQAAGEIRAAQAGIKYWRLGPGNQVEGIWGKNGVYGPPLFSDEPTFREQIYESLRSAVLSVKSAGMMPQSVAVSPSTYARMQQAGIDPQDLKAFKVV